MDYPDRTPPISSYFPYLNTFIEDKVLTLASYHPTLGTPPSALSPLEHL